MGRNDEKMSTHHKRVVVLLALGHTIDDSRVYHRMAKSLSLKYQVEVIAAETEASGLHKDDSDNRIRLHPLTGGRLKKAISALFIMGKIRPDVLHCHDPLSLEVGLTYKILHRKTKLIFDVHELYGLFGARSFGDAIAKFVLHKFIYPVFERFFIDAFVLVVPKQRERWGRFHKLVEVIYNFPKLEYFAQYDEVQSDSPKEYSLLYEGRVSEDRGALEYLKIIRGLKDDMPDAELALIGPTTEELELKIKEYIAANNLGGNVILTGRVPHLEIIRHIRAAKIGLDLLSDSLNNNYGIQNKVFEYMACGVPILGSKNVVSFNQMVVNEGCGLAVEFGNTDEAAKAIKEILANYAFFQTNCRRAIQKYNWENEEAKLLRFYEQI